MLVLISPSVVAQTTIETPRTIRVVTDNVYAPYSFQSDEGKLQGIVVDQWQAWEKKTGIKVEIHALDWGEAVRRMRAGEFDVIDCIVETPERRDYFDFTQAYTPIEASVFFRNAIPGITDIASLQGFPVGGKAGDQHVDKLKANGVTTVILFQNYDTMIDAAKQHKINVFVIDNPAALYLLNKAGIEDEFRHSAPMFHEELRRAVRKGDTALLRTVSEGFAAIEPDELKQIDEKWFGRTINRIGQYLTYAGYAVSAALLIIAGLTVWNRALRRKVLQRTAALGESEQRFRTIFEQVPLGISEGEIATARFINANQRYADILGYTIEELRELTFKDYSHPEDLQKDLVLFQKLAAGDIRTYAMEKRYLRKDGAIIWVNLTVSSLARSGEKPLNCIAVIDDITDRIQAEAAFRQLAQVSAASSDYIALIGRDFRYQFVNDIYLKARGLHLDDIIGRHMKEIVGQERFEQLGRPQVEACLRGEEVEGFEWTDFRSDLRCFLHVKVAPLREPDGTISGAVMSGRDITARYEAEQALRESEERFRALYNDVPSMYFTLNAAGIVLSVNEFGAAYLGYAPNELIGQPVHGIFVEEDRAMAREHVAESLANPSRTFDWELRKTRKDGRIVWVRETARAVRGRDGELAVLINCEDITERKVAAKELEEANHQLRFLSRRLFHLQEEERRHLARELHDEIGQLLTGAKINLEAAMKESDGARSKRIDETTAILEKLLGQVRQISLDLRPSMLDDLGLVPALRSLLDQQGRRASVAVHLSAKNVPKNLDPEIQTTCFRIAQEAITNAVRHANATRIDVDLSPENGNLRMRIRDNGRGFDAESMQAQTVGLGLIGIKERAALVDARAKIISSPNKGTTVEVSLPLTSSPEREGREIGK